MTTFFTADNHFGHSNIIEFCDRPFADSSVMDRIMIMRWNSRVSKNDTVWHLGDFTLSDDAAATFYLQQLNGHIIILGNFWHHDKRWLPRDRTPFQRSPFITIMPPMIVLELPELTGKTEYPQAIVLCHYPLAIWDRKHYGSWHLHGHSHGNFKGEGKILDVGVDCWDFYPVSLSEVVEALQEKK